MNKASERYNIKVEIPISVILETIFSDDNKDVETLCRWAKKYGFIDLEDKYYKLQDDYTKQSFYIWLSKKERKQYDYEDYLLNKNEQLQQENKQLKENLEDYERIFDIWNKRKLINKFNKEFSKEKVKEERAKGNKIVGVIPDAEYVYKKYYEKVEQIDKAIELNKQIKSFVYNEMVDRCVPGSTELYELVNEELKILGGENNR